MLMAQSMQRRVEIVVDLPQGHQPCDWIQYDAEPPVQTAPLDFFTLGAVESNRPRLTRRSPCMRAM
jgi:hypothetical protein